MIDVATMSDDELRRLVAERRWYHTIELRPGLLTPGWFDLRPVVPQLPIPADLTGRRALDVGTFEGFWARQLELRGADVTAIDILDPRQWDWPAFSESAVVAAVGDRKQSGEGFDVVMQALGSAVVRHELSVYDLGQDAVGSFDFVYVGSLLLHLRDPVAALEAVRSVLRPEGRLLLVDAIDVDLAVLHPRRPVAHLEAQGRPWWWRPNPAGLRRMVEAAGFDVLEGPRTLHLPMGAGHDPLARWSVRSVRSAEGRRELAMRRRGGDPHAWVLAKPRRPGMAAG